MLNWDVADEDSKEPSIVKVPDEDGNTHFELKNVPATGKDRIIGLFQVGQRPSPGQLMTWTYICLEKACKFVHGQIQLQMALFFALATG